MSLRNVAIAVALICLFGVAAFAQDAKIPVTVTPPEAYVFLDGVAIRDGNVTLKTTPGEHTIGVYNYGFAHEVRVITVKPGKNDPEVFNLKPTGDQVPGEFGLLQIEAPGRAAVLLNGTEPEYTVGHADEFNNHIFTSQQLWLLPGTHQVTVTRNGTNLWSGPVKINAGERVILSTKNGIMKRQPVKDVNGPRKRFTAGTASAAVVIAPVTATLAATPQNINCNETSQLVYSSTDALHTTMKGGADSKKLPDLNGQMGVSPRQTTNYEFQASGPGGLAQQQQAVNVNPVVQSTLEANPPQIHYISVGNKVLVQDTAALKWTTTNADTTSIAPMGTVATSGEQKLTAEPKATTGPVEENQSYTLTASNVCGGSDTKTVQVTTKGMIEPSILSVFFPTGHPDKKHPDSGLVASQQERLMKVVSIFPLYAEHTPDAKIVLSGFADPRGTNKYNMALSQRRVAAVKAFLIAHGIAENKIAVEALGETQVLDVATVDGLEAENPYKAETAAKQTKRAIWLAYNRRADVVVHPADVQTSRFFPHPAVDAKVLLQPQWPSHKKVMDAGQAASVATAGTRP